MRKRHTKDNDNTSEGGESTNQTSNRPKNNAVTQQRLPAINPKYDANTVLPFLFIVGILFIGIGIGILITSLNIQELEIDYTDCENADSKMCKEEIIEQEAVDRNCKCLIPIVLDKDWEGEILMYYGLRNFYQNHRLYVDSKNTDQLLGKMKNYNDSEDDNAYSACDPFYCTGTVDDNDYCLNGKIYFPCGAIANSMFSDVITLQDADNQNIPLTRTGIAWESDKEHKFSNPEGVDSAEKLKDLVKEYAKPKDWKKNLWELDPDNWSNNGLNNEDLIVWMRTAALPNFRKLYRRIPDGLKNGTYHLHIEYNFEVASFDGKKNIVLTTRSVLGGKNLFLGVTYIVVGGVCTILGVIFLLVHLKWGSRIKRGKKAMEEASR